MKRVDEEVWQALAQRIFFVGGDATDAAAYEAIKKKLDEIESERAPEERNRFFYLAVPPSVFEPIVRHALDERARAAASTTRTSGRGRASSWRSRSAAASRRRTRSTQLVLSLFAEHQVYRIDHYLGKETVQNVLVLRFANSIFEPLWNRQWISHVQITAAETVGVEARGKYYEEAGVVRDMFQNHLLQLLALTAMEPPPQMTADAVRDEKVKVLRVDSVAHAGDDSGERGARAVHGRAR